MCISIKILYDNNSYKNGLKEDWGFSCLIGDDLLFDTGADFEILAYNARKMGVDLNKIRTVVISHDHWDHTGGLWDLLKMKPGIQVFGCPGFSDEFKKKVLELRGRLICSVSKVHIKDNIFSTGEISGLYKSAPISEQSLVIVNGATAVVITGCSHPGIVNIIKKVKLIFQLEKITFLTGGFHLKDSSSSKIAESGSMLRFEQVGAISPCHCTGAAACIQMKGVFGEKYIESGAGFEISI